MALRRTVISALVFIILMAGGFKVYSTFHRPALHHLNPDLLWIGVIDLNNTHDFSPHAVLNGEDGVLVVDHASLFYRKMLQEIPEVKFLTQEELFDLSNLHLLDKNEEGVITAKDPIYQHLYIIQFHENGEQDSIKSLSEAGIHGIFVYTKAPTGEHLAMMADGTRRIIISPNKLEKS